MAPIERTDDTRYLDPITDELMVDPVVCNDGHTYERASAVRAQRSPFTHKPLAIVVDNISLRDELFDAFPEQRDLYNAGTHPAPTVSALKTPASVSSIKMPKELKPMAASVGFIGKQLARGVGKQWNKLTDEHESKARRKKEATRRFEQDALKGEVRRLQGLIDAANADKEYAVSVGDRPAAIEAITRRNRLQQRLDGLKQAMNVAVELTDEDSDGSDDSGTIEFVGF